MLILLTFLFSIVLFMSIFFSFFSVFDNNDSLYELQKAELYYRELEANLEYEKGVSINHNPIDFASFLLVKYGDFEFNEKTSKYLDEIFYFQYNENLNLKDIIKKILSDSEYDYFKLLYEIKCGFIKYGSPFNFDYEKYISSYVGYRIDPTSEEKLLELHNGLDIAVTEGTEILAISDGKVISATHSESYGNIVTIYHNDGYISKYAHCKSLNIKTGQTVNQGDVIAYVGSTGNSTGNHLHLEILDETGAYMNPIYLIESWWEIE